MILSNSDYRYQGQDYLSESAFFYLILFGFGDCLIILYLEGRPN